jgi:hypothetical protein
MRGVVLALMLAAGAAHAGDRPFQRLSTAAAEEDDDRVWSVDAVAERLGALRALGVQAEYAFDPVNSVQLGYAWARERGTRGRAQAFELEAKHLFNRIERDGWGWGMALGHAFTKLPGRGWRGGEWEVSVPASMKLGESGAFAHVTVGVSKARGESAERFLALGAQAEVARRWELFGEVAREDQSTLVNAGLRWWVQRERLAVDASLQRARGGSTRGSGFVFGLSWYDL